MSYVDGFVLIVPKKKVGAYKKLATKAGKIWREHGALGYYECLGDDLKTKFGVPFTRMAKAKRNDTVFFSFIIYKDKAHRNRVNAKVMKDKRLNGACDEKNMPFDIKRMAYGGFKAVVKF
ncbi:MAG: DUF1428 domain-containing protein [Alphaproteobacteria bacterium]